jgi:thioredoxin reductase (NADPH)
MIDCAIIGGGPAGLTAAIYLTRFHLSVRLFDDGNSRAALIPCTHNHAGYPGGIKGTKLLRLMHEQASDFGVTVTNAHVDAIERNGERIDARTVLLATGVVNNRPEMDDAEHDRALAAGLLRYCPVCDGYEVTDKRVGVIGTGDHGMREALFLRGYTADVTLIAPGAAHELDETCVAELQAGGIAHVDGPGTPIKIADNQLSVMTAKGPMLFDSVYPALGSVIRSELAVVAGANAAEDGCLEVDSHQRTSIPGLFAAGDVVKGLDQISHAMGEAGVAATTIRNMLDQRQRLRR